MEKIIIQTIDCGRHDYWKVSLDLLDSLNIFDAISEYSYLGNGKEPLNEDGYAYLEIDSDCGIFDKAQKSFLSCSVLNMTVYLIKWSLGT